MGRLGKLWVEMCIIGYLMGCCVAYLVVLGDLGPEMLDRLGLADPETPEWSVGCDHLLDSGRYCL